MSRAKACVEADAVEAFADVISREAIYCPSEQRAPLSSLPSHTNDAGTSLFSLRVLSAVLEPAFIILNTYFTIPPLPACVTGVKEIVSLTLSPFGENALSCIARSSVAFVVSKLNASERTATVLPAKSVAESSYTYEPSGTSFPASSRPSHETVSGGNSPSEYSRTAFVILPEA